MDMNGSRRSFLKGSAVAGTAYIVGSPALAASIRSSVIVVGAGSFGGWSALQFAQRGAKVTLIDAWGRSRACVVHKDGGSGPAVMAGIRATMESKTLFPKWCAAHGRRG